MAGAQAGPIITVQDTTPAGDNPGIGDSEIRLPVVATPGDELLNRGVATAMRIYTDAGPFDNPDNYGGRHALFDFDVSLLNGVGIVNAEFVFHVISRKETKVCSTQYTDMKLSAFTSGKGWFEGTGDGVPCLNGEVNAVDQIYDDTSYPPGKLWDNVGADAPVLDIDVPSQKTLTIGGGWAGAIVEYRVNVTDWVQGWTSGYDNNGFMLHGGYIGDGNAHSGLNYWLIPSSEYQGGDIRYWWPGEAPYTTTIGERPRLEIEIPEPATLLMLGVGFIPVLWRRRSL